MSRVVEIPGGSATIRGKDEVQQRARRRLEAALIDVGPAFKKINDKRREMAREKGMEVAPEEVNLSDAGLTREDFDAMYEMQTATILAYLQSWSLEREMPKTQEELDDLPVGLYDALRAATVPEGADAVVERVDFEPHPDADRPTEGGTGSGSRSRAGRASSSTQRSGNSGTNSVTDGSSD